MKYSILVLFFLLVILGISFQECKQTEVLGPVYFQPEEVPYKKLSEYAFFKKGPSKLSLNEHVLPYDLITPLFSDYAHKARAVWMPDSVQASIGEDGSVLFPDNTVLIKTFYYPEDFNSPDKNLDLVETRLLIKTKGNWQAFTYVWNEEETDADLNLIGDFKEVSWQDEQGEKHAIQYNIPNKNQCKSCHNYKGNITPIGPKAQYINKELIYADGQQVNQILKWQQVGFIPDDLALEQFKPIVQWNAPQSGSLEERALAYLEVNCAHCHNEGGPANTSGLYLSTVAEQREKLGFCKPPVAAGKGSGGREFSIVPGQPDSSILVFRMESTDPGVMMPEIGRLVPHQEGIHLIKEWIGSLDGNCDF